ncbi:hypothetical protein AGMMS50212_03570 [Spirochaetia bacterium]|nr:hypothetical protein AGMMS50212_03570 [Spirochaetia bacterium]
MATTEPKKTKKSKRSAALNVVIFILILAFVLMIIWTVYQRRQGVKAGVGGVTAGQSQTRQINVPGGPAGNAPSNDSGPRMRDGSTQGTSSGRGGGSGSTGSNVQNGGRQQGAGMANNAQGGARQGAGQQMGSASRNAQSVRITPAVLGTIENSIVINGDVLAVREVSIFPVVAGKISELRLRVGDAVRQGQIVAVVDPSRPGEVYSSSPVRSTINGTILQVPYSTGDTVSAQSAIYVVGDLSSLVVETFVPERFSSSVQNGLKAEIYFDSISGETWRGTVSEVSPVLDPASRTLRIRLRFEKSDPRIRAGMFATVSLVTNAHRNVLVIPRTAMISTYGSWIVFVVNENNIAERREISLGLESETQVEVLSGLKIGDKVVSSGQNFLSNNESVRIVSD